MRFPPQLRNRAPAIDVLEGALRRIAPMAIAVFTQNMYRRGAKAPTRRGGNGATNIGAKFHCADTVTDCNGFVGRTDTEQPQKMYKYSRKA